MLTMSRRLPPVALLDAHIRDGQRAFVPIPQGTAIAQAPVTFVKKTKELHHG
jgi:hypothetical protein